MFLAGRRSCKSSRSDFTAAGAAEANPAKSRVLYVFCIWLAYYNAHNRWQQHTARI